MALIQCPECGLQVSSKGAACPRCAYPIEKLTNLFQASKENDVEMVQDLLHSGADPNTVDKEGASPLMIASYHGHEQIAKVLLAAGADPNLKRGRGVTALMDAAYRGHTLLVRALLDAGADPAIISETGMSAIELSKKKRRLEIKALLEQAVLQQELKEMQAIPQQKSSALEQEHEEGETPAEEAQRLDCLKCSEEIGLEDLTCPHCGVPILRRYCGRCSRLIPDHVNVCPVCKTSEARSFHYRSNIEGAVLTGVVAIALGVWIIGQSWYRKPPDQRIAKAGVVQSELDPDFMGAMQPAPANVQSQHVRFPQPDPLSVPPIPVSHSGHSSAKTRVADVDQNSKTQLARARKLNSAGYHLMKQGRYDEAADLLSKAIRLFPQGHRDLTYAYTLYNLGRSLRLSGHPENAVRVLEERMKFNDQQNVVQRELQAARREAGDPDAWGVQYE
jgi:uncharacterized protein